MNLPQNVLKKIKKTFDLEENVPMSAHTSFGIGGSADLFAKPGSREELAGLVAMTEKEGVPVTLIGGGTNILVLDGGIRGVVISMKGILTPINLIENQDKNLKEIKKVNSETVRVTAPSGILLAKLARFAMEKGFSGLGFCAGIPGTLGGAVMMNAGTNIGTMADVVSKIGVLGPHGELRTFDQSELIFEHRSLTFQVPEWEPKGNVVVLSVAMDLHQRVQEKFKLKADWNTLLKYRKNTQPVSMASSGCFFKNPKGGMPAGMLIDKAGLKGCRVGDAMVSDIHANFIVNLGSARAVDVLALKSIVEETVMDEFGVKLEAEVQINGE